MRISARSRTGSLAIAATERSDAVTHQAVSLKAGTHSMRSATLDPADAIFLPSRSNITARATSGLFVVGRVGPAGPQRP